jgi:hypothetical protein
MFSNNGAPAIHLFSWTKGEFGAQVVYLQQECHGRGTHFASQLRLSGEAARDVGGGLGCALTR